MIAERKEVCGFSGTSASLSGERDIALDFIVYGNETNVNGNGEGAGESLHMSGKNFLIGTPDDIDASGTFNDNQRNAHRQENQTEGSREGESISDHFIQAGHFGIICGNVLHFILERVVARPESKRRGVFLFSFPCEIEKGQSAENAAEAADDSSGHADYLLAPSASFRA